MSAAITYETPTNKHDLVAFVTHKMGNATLDLLAATHEHGISEPDPSDRQTTVEIVPVAADAVIPGWSPRQTSVYTSRDPFWEANPVVTEAMGDYIGTAIEVAAVLAPTKDASLTYLNANRATRGKKDTLLTKIIKSTDPVLADWITNLPAAERLRPAANPWSEVPTIVVKDGELVNIPTSIALQLVCGASGDGRAMREREAWERTIVERTVANTELPHNRLVMTSLGTGTGEPAMDTALSAMGAIHGSEPYDVLVHGYDNNPNSLRVARHIAGLKDSRLRFVGHGVEDILSEQGLVKALQDTQPNVIEAIGLAEYVPSDDAPTETEVHQRKLMKRMNSLSAQEFFATIYDNMAAGSVFVTGNMNNTSPQAEFITNGLGWKGIIQRSTADYMRIIRESGIPASSVELFLPAAVGSAAVYNLVAITKQ